LTRNLLTIDPGREGDAEADEWIDKAGGIHAPDR
jgi:hypothetical protein